VVHYFNMSRKEIKLKGLSESRFGSMIFLFRMAGIPFKRNKVSTIYAIYMITFIVRVCATTTYLGMFIDVYVHREGLGLAMTTMRVLISCKNVMWIFSNCR